MKRPHGEGSADKKAKRNYKLISDPALKGGHEKLYRFDGDLPEVWARACHQKDWTG